MAPWTVVYVYAVRVIANDAGDMLKKLLPIVDPEMIAKRFEECLAAESKSTDDKASCVLCTRTREERRATWEKSRKMRGKSLSFLGLAELQTVHSSCFRQYENGLLFDLSRLEAPQPCGVWIKMCAHDVVEDFTDAPEAVVAFLGKTLLTVPRENGYPGVLNEIPLDIWGSTPELPAEVLALGKPGVYLHRDECVCCT